MKPRDTQNIDEEDENNIKFLAGTGYDRKKKTPSTAKQLNFSNEMEKGEDIREEAFRGEEDEEYQTDGQMKNSRTFQNEED